MTLKRPSQGALKQLCGPRKGRHVPLSFRHSLEIDSSRGAPTPQRQLDDVADILFQC